jgi:hypothetical protein
VPAPKPCKAAGCGGKKDLPSHFCYWHKVERLPIDEQIEYAMARRELALKSHEVRATVPAAAWPPGRRFCSGCQFMVPLWYTSGAKCKACQSHASYGSHLANTFHISYDTYLAMLKFQDYRCYICRKRPLTRRLAVDHDHVTNKLRGLLCSGERSCNHDVLGNIKDLPMARRIVTYLETPPYELMLAGGTIQAEVATAGPTYRGAATTILPTQHGLEGTAEIMARQAAEAIERRAKACWDGHYSDKDFWRFPEGTVVFDIFHAEPDKLDPKVWEARLRLARERQASIAEQRARG